MICDLDKAYETDKNLTTTAKENQQKLEKYGFCWTALNYVWARVFKQFCMNSDLLTSANSP